MPSDMRSISFIFHRDTEAGVGNSRANQSHSHLRRRLQDRFEKEDPTTKINNSESNWHNISQDSKRVLRSSAEKITRTWSSVKLSIDTMSQKFKSSTRRCRILEEQYTPIHGSTLQTPQTRSRRLLGRTPTKLYSPFGIESPKSAWDKDLDVTPAHAVPKLTTRNKSQRFFRMLRQKSFYSLR